MRVAACIVTNMKQRLDASVDGLLSAGYDEIVIICHNDWHTLTISQALYEKVTVLYCPDSRQSYKRKTAYNYLYANGYDAVYFVDDDAVADKLTRHHIEHEFKCLTVPLVGMITGPSLLPEKATVMQRLMQMVMANNPRSGCRYAQHNYRTHVDSSVVIGCNMAVKLVAMKGFDPNILPSYGEEYALAEHVLDRGYTITYNPHQVVYHPPHGFFRQSRQIFGWGRTSKLTGAKTIDPALFFYPLLQTWFSFLWSIGRLSSTLSVSRIREFTNKTRVTLNENNS